MNLTYWNRAAACYDDDIFSVLRNDRNGVLLRAMDQVANPRGVAGDLGCGSGIILPEVARRFGRVHAIDLSPKLVEIARASCRRFTNIEYGAADLSRRGKALATLPKLDVVVNVNVLIAESRSLREAILENLIRALRPGGHLLLVVPSLESVLWTTTRLAEWNRRRRTPRLPDKVVDAKRTGEGIVKIEGVPTKHYLREELELEMTTRGLKVQALEKIEYHWDTEFDEAPKWMGAPFPWDWMCLAQRSGK